MVRIRKILKVAMMSLCFTAAIGANAGAQTFACYWHNHNLFLDYYDQVERPVSTTGSSHGKSIDLSEVSQKKTPEAVEVVSKAKETTVGKSVEAIETENSMPIVFTGRVGLDAIYSTYYHSKEDHTREFRGRIHITLKAKGCKTINFKKNIDIYYASSVTYKVLNNIKVPIYCTINRKTINVGTLGMQISASGEANLVLTAHPVNVDGKTYIVMFSPAILPVKSKAFGDGQRFDGHKLEANYPISIIFQTVKKNHQP